MHAHVQHVYAAYATDKPPPAMVQQVDPRVALVKPRPVAEYPECVRGTRRQPAGRGLGMARSGFWRRDRAPHAGDGRDARAGAIDGAGVRAAAIADGRAAAERALEGVS